MLLAFLTTCDSSNNRIGLIESKSGLVLPETFDIVRNQSIDEGSFDEDNFKILLENVENVIDREEWVKMKAGSDGCQ